MVATPKADWPQRFPGLVAAVSQRTGIGQATMLGRSRERRVIYARRLVMFVLAEHFGVAISELARRFDCHHSTVCDGLRQIRHERKLRPETAADIAAIIIEERRPMTAAETHELKCWPESFEAILDGRKTFEIRREDRAIEVGDELVLREWLPDLRIYSARECRRVVTYRLRGSEINPLWGVTVAGVIYGLAEPPEAP